MEETLVFIDEGFLDKLTKLLGEGKRLKFNKFNLAKKIANNQNLLCKHLFYYTCPPFQSEKPSVTERRMREGYDKFISALSKNKDITIREGRCQKVLNEKGEFEYHQKGVDTLLTIDLEHIKDDFPDINKIILISSDTDFCPAIKDIEKRDEIKVILYTYFDRKRRSKFSLSNELINCCSSYFKLTKEDFIFCPIKRENDK
ncbi:MAG: NYN domain-containing protein [Nanoarchaeota archaeon]|nr:NYN domain-containing protein [Nanoarchaeota archaeon]